MLVLRQNMVGNARTITDNVTTLRGWAHPTVTYRYVQLHLTH